MPLVLIGIATLALFYFALGSALQSASTAQAHTAWYVWITKAVLAVPIEATKLSIQLAKYLAHFMYPGLQYAEDHVSGWFQGLGQATKYNRDHAYRTSYALSNFATWVSTSFHEQILYDAEHAAKIANAKNALTKAPPLPQKRLTQHEVDIEFQRLIESLTPSQLEQIDPKRGWDKDKWLKYLGILPALGDHVVTTQPVQPAPVKVKTAQPVTPTVPIGPPQPTTLPHTDDAPNPEPGTQLVPGVVSAKDKWARGQIVKLRDFEESTRRHLGPLAFLAIPIAGITTLIGLLECKNVQRGLKGFCSMPSNLLNDLLALITDFLVLTNICTVLPWIEDAANEVLPFITEFTTGAAALACSGGRQISPTLTVPTLQLPPSTGTLPALQLP